MDRVFLDANVLFSIAYDPSARIAAILKLADAEFVTSRFAAAEALRNIDAKKPSQLHRLRRILKKMKLVSEGEVIKLPEGLSLAEKDRPIMSASIECGATHLLTGDKHFRHLFGRVVHGVLLMRPADYLRMREGSSER